MKQRKNLEQIKNMISKNKKIVIAIILIIILSLVIGIAFASKPSDNKKTESQTEQKIDVSEENNNKEEEDKKEENENSKTDKNTDNSNTTSTTKDNNNSSTDSNKKDTSSSNSGNSNSGNSGNSNSNSGSSSNTGNSGGSDKPSKPAHQHSWKQHTAQKWVSNMVTVPDYETQKVYVGTRYTFFYDGYSTMSAADADNHSMELILAGLPDNYRSNDIYEEKQVQVGSHQEDHGHNETYVDYEYCDCGARR